MKDSAATVGAVYDHACPNYDWRGMSSRIEYRGEAASLLSRGAATVCSPGRKPGEDVVFEVKPRRGERSYEICRTYGAHARKGRNPPACARGYILSPLRGFNRMRFARYFGQQCCWMYNRPQLRNPDGN